MAGRYGPIRYVIGRDDGWTDSTLQVVLVKRCVGAFISLWVYVLAHHFGVDRMT